jgi:hypothetical protein
MAIASQAVSKARVAFEESRRSLEAQEARLERIRSTSLTVSTIGLGVVAFFASMDGIGQSATGLAGTAAVGAVPIALMLQLERTMQSRFSSKVMVEQYVDNPEYTEDAMLRQFAIYVDEAVDENESVLHRLQLWLVGACLLVLLALLVLAVAFTVQ